MVPTAKRNCNNFITVFTFLILAYLKSLTCELTWSEYKDQEARYGAHHEYDEPYQLFNHYMQFSTMGRLPLSPLYFGFFFNYEASSSIHHITRNYLTELYNTLPDFRKFFETAMYVVDELEFLAYFKKPRDIYTNKSDPYFHVLTKYCGHAECYAYWKKTSEVLGKGFDVSLIGLYITKRTFGIRVQLTLEEQKIYDVDYRENTVQASPSNISDEILRSQNSPELTGCPGFNDTTHNYHSVYFYPQSYNFHPTESRAHVTVGLATGIDEKQAEYDLLELIDLEITENTPYSDFVVGEKVPKSIVRIYRLGDQSDEPNNVLISIYPSCKIIAKATFSVYL